MKDIDLTHFSEWKSCCLRLKDGHSRPLIIALIVSFFRSGAGEGTAGSDAPEN